MARKKRPQSHTPLPLSAGEVWEVGRRPLAVHVEELAQRSEQPEVLLAVQIGESGGVVHGDAISSRTPPTALVDFVLQAIRQPLLGAPRRPEVIRVSSHLEAEMLAVPLASTGIALEITAPLAALDAFHAHMGQALGGLTNDYRTQAAQAGERLRKADLLAFFRVAKAFYAEELWWTYGDEVFCEIVFEHGQRPVKTLYGILMGSMGQEFGLALFHALDDLQQFYNLSVQHLDVMTDRTEENALAQGDLAQLQREAEVMAQLLEVPTMSLTYTPQEEVPAPLLQEARRLKLPLANDLAFPLVMRTGQRGMQVATATELAEMFSALRALLDWNTRLRPVGNADEIDTTISTTLPAVEGFAPALTARTTLRLNPYVPAEEEGEEDEDTFLPDPDIEAFFGTLFTEPVKRKVKPHSKKKSGTKSAGKTAKAKNKSRKKVGPTAPQHPKDAPEM